MPYDPNPNWTARTNAAAKAPVYYVEFDGLTTKHFSTAPVRAAATTKKLLLRVPDNVAQKISQLQGRASLNLITFELVDRDGEITDLVATEKASPTLPTLINRKVTLRDGYADLNESDYGIAGVGQIDGVEATPEGPAYRFSVVDLKRHQFDDLFRNADANQSVAVNTTFAADAAVGAQTITLVSAAQISGASGEASSEGDNLYLGPSTDAGYTGQELRVKAHVVSGNVVTLTATLTKAFKAGDEVRWATSIIEGNPINMIYALLTGDFASATFPLTKKRGELTGLGIAAASIDSVGLQKERDRAYDSEIWRFEIKDPVPAFRFLEQKIYRMLGYPVTSRDGKLGFRLYRPAYPDSVLPTLLKADMIHWRWKRAHELHVNRIEIGVDFDAETGKAAEIVVTEDTADQAATKETVSFEQEDTGLRAALRGVRLAENIGAVLSRRFLVPPPQLELWCLLTKRALQVGEVLAVTNDEIPNVKTGTRGLTALRLEIVEPEENFRAGEMRFLLQDANYSRPGWIGDDAAQQDYDLATAAEKEYGYIAPDAGNFADGGSPFEIA